MPSISNGAQRSENVRKNSFLNYKSAALPAELCRHLRGKSFHSHSLFPAIVSLFLYPSAEKRMQFERIPSAAGRLLSAFSGITQID